jgi:hypothetical protein
MTSPKLIRNKIIELIENFDFEAFGFGDFLSNAKWFKGQPPRSRFPNFPCGWVEWNGGVMQPPVGSKTQVLDNFYIVVVDKNINAEIAEDNIMDFAEAVKAALDQDVTIDGLVAYSWITNREKEKQFEGDYSLVAIRLTLSTRRNEL